MNLLPFRTHSHSLGYRTRVMARRDLIAMDQFPWER